MKHKDNTYKWMKGLANNRSKYAEGGTAPKSVTYPLGDNFVHNIYPGDGSIITGQGSTSNMAVLNAYTKLNAQKGK